MRIFIETTADFHETGNIILVGTSPAVRALGKLLGKATRYRSLVKIAADMNQAADASMPMVYVKRGDAQRMLRYLQASSSKAAQQWFRRLEHAAVF